MKYIRTILMVIGIVLVCAGIGIKEDTAYAIDNGEMEIPEGAFKVQTRHTGFKREMMQSILDLSRKSFMEKEYQLAGILQMLCVVIETEDEVRFGAIVAEYSKRVIKEIE